MNKYKLLNDVKAYYKVIDNVYIELTKEEYYEELYKLTEKLQKRINKAIEYIEQQHLYEIYFNHKEETHKLLEILKGDNK